MKVPVTLVAAGLLVVTGAALGQSLSKNPHPPTMSVGGNAPVAVGPVSITQSTSLVPVTGSSVACTNTGVTSDNSYWRAFTLASFPALDSTFFIVESVDIGIEGALAGSGGAQPAVLRLWTNSGAAFPGGSATLLSTTSVSIADQSLTLLNIPVAPSVAFTNATDVLVVELHVDDATTGAGHQFFIGSNSSGQTAPGYISSTGCAIATPTDIATIGFPNMHMIMRVNGQNQTTPVELQRVTIE